MTSRPRSFWANVLAVAYKETSAIRHDRALLGAIIAQPVVMLLLFGLAVSNKPANVRWAVLDQSQTAVSRRLIEEIQTTGYFVPPQPVWDYDDGRQLLQQGTALVFLVIPQSFRRDIERGQPRVQLLVDGSDPLNAARVSGYINLVANGFATRPTPPPRIGRTSEAGPLDIRQRFWFNPTLRDRDFFLSAIVGMLLTNLCLSATSLGLVGERESGTYEQMLSLPTTPLELVLGKLLPYVGLSYVVLLLATVAAALGFDVWPHGSWLALLVVTLPFVLASLGIGVLVSTLAHTSAQAVFISVFFIMPSFILSGVMFPYQLMPHGVREVGGLAPLRWYQIALRRINERGAGLAEVLVPLLILVLLFAVILMITRARVRPRLD
jgi:ABC-2 type transport system permease protein